MSRMQRIRWALSCAVMLSAIILLGVGQARAESFEPVVREASFAAGGVVILDAPEGERVTAELLRRQIIVDHRPGAGIRMSPHFYTADHELEHTIHELSAIIHSAPVH